MADNLKYDIAKSFQRTKEFPLDRTSVFNSLAAATSYAAGEGPLGKTSYLGQILAVVEDTNVDVYKIGYDTLTGRKVLMSIGGADGQAVTTESITIGNVTIPVGSDLTDALHAIETVVEDMGSTDGKITEDIVISGQTYASAGTPTTTVVKDLYSKVINNATLTKNIMSGSTIALAKGSNLTTVAERLFQIIENQSGGTGYITEPILNEDGEVIIQSGLTTTEAFAALVEYYEENGSKISGLEPEDEDVNIVYNDDGTVTVGVAGVSNNSVISLDEEKLITLQFSDGTTSMTGRTWGDWFEFTLPDTNPSGGIWKVDANMDGVVTEPGENFNPGDTVKIVGITSAAGDVTVTATAYFPNNG